VGTHPLQLPVYDCIKNSRAAGIISRIRNVNKEARNSKLSDIIIIIPPPCERRGEAPPSSSGLAGSN
jgi:hypothetical protein